MNLSHVFPDRNVLNALSRDVDELHRGDHVLVLYGPNGRFVASHLHLWGYDQRVMHRVFVHPVLPRNFNPEKTRAYYCRAN